MAELNLETRIALQDEIWKRFQLPVPSLEALLTSYINQSKKELPERPDEIAKFISDGFAEYLEPIPGFISSKNYSKTQLEKAGITLIEKGEGLGGWHKDYQDEKTKTWWTDVEGRHGELIGTVFQLLGRNRR